MAALKVKFAANVIRAGGVIAYPTETVWGLGCNPDNPKAIQQLLDLKRRDPAKGLILIGGRIEHFARHLQGLDTHYLKRLENTWPGPFTFLVPDNGTAHPLITGHFDSVALRVSANKQVAALCEAFGGPIVSTSANLAGHPTPRWPWQLCQQLGAGLDYLLPGYITPGAKPSEIRDLISDRVIRAS